MVSIQKRFLTGYDVACTVFSRLSIQARYLRICTKDKDKALAFFLCSLGANQVEYHREITGI